MGFRFRKSIKVLPGVRVNLGKAGVTGVNIGKRGAASVTVGRDGSHLNVGTPIDGLNYRERIGGEQTPAAPSSGAWDWGAGARVVVGAIGAGVGLVIALAVAIVKAMFSGGGRKRRR